jgi:flagellar basal-body rod modification protein FlgD
MTDTPNIPKVTPSANALAQTPDNKKTKDVAKERGQINEQEFLTLLVNQLQNQDPLDPMDSQQFAVQLAQFSQVEQLTQINKKMDNFGGGADSVGSLASFLGMEVSLKDGPMKIEAGRGADLLVDFPKGVQSARVDFLDDKGTVVGSEQLQSVESGKQSLQLSGLALENGDYNVRVVAVTSSGQFKDIKARAGGIVEGFVMEPESALLINGIAVPATDVNEVKIPQRASA